jgi:hypothetical protein
MKFILKNIILLFLIVLALYISKASDSTEFSKFDLFPVKRGNTISIGVFLGSGINNSSSSSISSSSFINPRGFQQTPVFGMKNARVRHPFSEAYSTNYPKNSNVRTSIEILYHTGSIIDFGFNLSFDFISEVLYNENEMLFLNEIKLPEAFKERTFIDNSEILFKAGAGLSIPLFDFIQGNFKRSARIERQSFSIYLGVSVATPIKSEATQYLQIVNNDLLRYRNGTDTLVIINDSKLETLNSFRSYFDVLLSWRISGKMGFGADLYYSYQLNSVLEDSDWKQWFLGLRFSLLFINFRR